MRHALLVLLIVGCQPGGVGPAAELCAKAAAMYERCESRGDLDAQRWELVLDRWRGMCRASITGETHQLLPDALALWHQLSDEVKAGLRVQAECSARAQTCAEYTACSEDVDQPRSGP